MSISSRLPERPRILVITLRRLGDVLLTTPLIRTIRRGFPQATLDVLVFRGSAPILEGNPDIDNVRTMPERPSAGEPVVCRPSPKAAGKPSTHRARPGEPPAFARFRQWQSPALR
jgi:hypothetical protein